MRDIVLMPANVIFIRKQTNILPSQNVSLRIGSFRESLQSDFNNAQQFLAGRTG